MGWQEEDLARFYPRDRGWTDGTAEFHGLCRALIPRGAAILELGAGPANPTSAFLATLGAVDGVDVDAAVLRNPHLRRAHVLAGDALPFGDGAFDACVSNYVLEHVADPAGHLREVCRVLKPGGRYLLRTPNLFHYVGMVSRLTPYRFHLRVANRLRRRPPGAHDPYPTHYRCNTRGALRRLAGRAGLRVDRLDMVEKEPSYGLASRALFRLFVGYERLVNASGALAGLRSNIFAVLRRPE